MGHWLEMSQREFTNRLLLNLAQNRRSKWTIETLEQGGKYAQYVLVSLLLTLNIFYALF